MILISDAIMVGRELLPGASFYPGARVLAILTNTIRYRASIDTSGIVYEPAGNHQIFRLLWEFRVARTQRAIGFQIHIF